jgi:hypothetical protein
MLSREENERLTRVAPGTAMGALFRRYWLPALPTGRHDDPERGRRASRLPCRWTTRAPSGTARTMREAQAGDAYLIRSAALLLPRSALFAEACRAGQVSPQPA